jgi:hypothetical protein
MILRSQPNWPKSFDFLRSLTMNLTPEGTYQAVHVLRPETLPGDEQFEVLFEGSHTQCTKFLESVVRQALDREKTAKHFEIPDSPPKSD